MDRRTFLSTWALLGACGLPFRSFADDRRGKGRILVVGGGYGGASVARYLKLLDHRIDVSLIHRDPAYQSCPGANEVVAGLQTMDWLRRTYDKLARLHAVKLVCGDVVDIDHGKSAVVLRDGRRLTFDRLVLSPGIAFRWDALEGYDEAASRLVPHAWQGGSQVELLRKQLQAMRTGGTAIIVAPANPYRCPPGPYERASLIAYYLQRHNPRAKILILDAKTQFSKQALFMKGWEDLYPGMIEWIPGSKEGSIERIDAAQRIVHSEFGTHRADLLNVIPPQQAGELAKTAGLTDDSGWCPIDPMSFASRRSPKIHVIGDACVAAPMPKSAFSANSQAKVCAAAIVDLLHDRPPERPSLINHCYSFLKPDYAISVTGVYEYSTEQRELVASSTGETAWDADRRLEARYAKAWQIRFARDVFG